jgi:hypothetical protein
LATIKKAVVWRRPANRGAESQLQKPAVTLRPGRRARGNLTRKPTPLLRTINKVQCESPDRPVTVILPELIDGRWWGYLMHTKRERRLRAHLLRHAPNVVVSSVPWQLQAAHPEQAIAEEEPARATGSPKPAA